MDGRHQEQPLAARALEVGDLQDDGDGFDDVIVGAPRADGPADGRVEAGDSCVWWGEAAGCGGSRDLDDDIPF